MSRRIDTSTVTATPPGAIREDYPGRLAKYIPAEVVAAYLFVVSEIPRTDNRPDAKALWIVAALCWVLTPVYMWFATRQAGKKPLLPQIILATIAFPVWIFAIGGPFETLTWYRSWIAGIILTFVTIIFGFVKPAPNT